MKLEKKHETKRTGPFSKKKNMNVILLIRLPHNKSVLFSEYTKTKKRRKIVEIFVNQIEDLPSIQ